MCRTHLPEDVIKDFDDFFKETEVPRMDSSGNKSGSHGTYTVSDTKYEHTFNGVEMPPPCGYFGVNYSRYVPVYLHQLKVFTAANSHTHNEKCPHTFGISWTTRKHRGEESDNGGDFYISDYGIKVEAAQNTVIVWRPQEWHGTTLPQQDPSISQRPEFSQAGISLVTSAGVVQEWYKEQQNP